MLQNVQRKKDYMIQRQHNEVQQMLEKQVCIMHVGLDGLLASQSLQNFYSDASDNQFGI